MGLVMNAETLKQKRSSIQNFRERRKFKTLKACFEAWPSACEKLSQETYQNYLLNKFFQSLKQNMAESQIAQNAKADKSNFCSVMV